MNLAKKKGFTLIEIVIVLAIAALILIIVFLAVAGAQRSRRDEQRRNDAARLVSAAENQASNANGTYPAAPADGANFQALVGFSATDPSTNAQYTQLAGLNATTGSFGNMRYAPGNICNGNVVQAANANDVAVLVKLEPGPAQAAANAAVACFSNRNQ